MANFTKGVILFLLLISLPILYYASHSSRNIRSKAEQTTQTTVTSASLSTPSRGVARDFWADIVLGKDRFGEGIPGEVAPFKVFNPGGAVVDRTVKPNRLYIYDGGNSRILGYNSLGVCQNNAALHCTADSDCPGSVCNIQVAGKNGTKSPAIIIGQPDFYHSACNGDFNLQSYPQRTKASESTLCSMPEFQISTTEGGSHASLAVDQVGNLYVGDFDNNRVLMYKQPLSSDKTQGKGDAKADEVFGQENFTGNSCNRVNGDANNWYPGIGQPNNNTFCFRSIYNEGFGAGVEIDQQGNLWLADNQNNRVLRFSKDAQTGLPKKSADLVLGQPNFTSAHKGSSLYQMWAPVAVRVDTKNSSVYVADSLNNRILVFDPPLSNGKTATRTLGSKLRNPTGVEIDPQGQGVWVNDSLNYQLVLFGFDGQVKKVLMKDTYQPNASCGSETPDQYRSCINPQKDPVTGENVCWSTTCNSVGSMGIDTEGNIYVTGSDAVQDVYIFKAPIPTPSYGKFYSAYKRLFYPPNYPNHVFGKKGFLYPFSITQADKQLVVADGNRVLFWNMPNGVNDLSNGKQADGVVGTSDFDKRDAWGFGHIAAQGENLWVVRKSTVEVYKLPLSHGAIPPPNPQDPNERMAVISYKRPLPVLGGGTISWGFDDDFMGIAADPNGKYIWLSQGGEYTNIHRVFRVKDPLVNPVVDVILGHATYSETGCNRDPKAPSDYVAAYAKKAPNTVCFPSAVKIDRLGNIWVSDFSLEFKGNRRLLEYDSILFSNITTEALYGPNASRIINDVMVLDMAFDSQNRMFAGYNGYSDLRFPAIYLSPLTTNSPNLYLKDYFSMPAPSFIDGQNNVYISDYNRGRILIYKNPISQSISPTLILSPTKTPTKTPSPAASIIPTRTPTKSPPTKTPTKTPTPIPTNLISNPSFELDYNLDGKPDNWSTNSHFVRSKDIAHSGTYACRHQASDGSSYVVTHRINNITGGKNYSLTGWTFVILSRSGGKYDLQIRWLDSSSNVISTNTVKTYTSTTLGWEKTVFALPAPPNAKTAVIRMNITGLNGTIYVDDFDFR